MCVDAPSTASRHPILVAILTAVVLLPALQGSDVCTAGIAHHLPQSTELTGTQSSTHPPLHTILRPQRRYVYRFPSPFRFMHAAAHRAAFCCACRLNFFGCIQSSCSAADLAVCFPALLGGWFGCSPAPLWNAWCPCALPALHSTSSSAGGIPVCASAPIVCSIATSTPHSIVVWNFQSILWQTVGSIVFCRGWIGLFQ